MPGTGTQWAKLPSTQLALCTDTNPSHKLLTSTQLALCTDTNPSHKLPSTQLALCRHKPFTKMTKHTAYTVQTFHTNYQVHSLHCADTNPSHKLPTDLCTQLALCTDTNPLHSSLLLFVHRDRKDYQGWGKPFTQTTNRQVHSLHCAPTQTLHTNYQQT